MKNRTKQVIKNYRDSLNELINVINIISNKEKLKIFECVELIEIEYIENVLKKISDKEI